MIYCIELYLTLFGASAKKKAGCNSLIGVLSYWTKHRNTSPAGSRDWVQFGPPMLHRYPAVNDGQLISQQNHSCSFCSHSHRTHTCCLGCTLPLTARRVWNTVAGAPYKRLTQCRPQTWWKYERLWQLLRLHLKCFKISPLLQWLKVWEQSRLCAVQLIGNLPKCYLIFCAEFHNKFVTVG